MSPSAPCRTLVMCLATVAWAVSSAAVSLRGGLMVSTAAPMGRRSALPGLESTLAAQLQRPHVGVAPGDTPVVLHFALNHDDADKAAELDRRFWDANTPGSEQEGQYVSPSEMAELMAPHEDTLQALHVWLADEGVPSSSVHLSPWKDHLFVDTDVDTAQRLLQMPLHAYRHSSSDPEVVGKLVVAADSGELPASHPHASRVAIVRVAGSVDAASMGVRRDMAESKLPPVYPFSFWPPSPVIAAEVTNTNGLILHTMVTCASWIPLTYPFNLTPPAFNATTPCGDEAGQIESFSVSVRGPSGRTQNATWNVTWATTDRDRGCKERDYVAYVCVDLTCKDQEQQVLTLATCSFEISTLDFELDELYSLSVASTLSNSRNGGFQAWTSFPANDTLHVVRTAAKTPSLVRQHYGVPATAIACQANNSQAVGVAQQLWGDACYHDSDIQEFYTRSGVPANEAALVDFVSAVDASAGLDETLSKLGWGHEQVALSRCAHGKPPDGETTLDVEWISSVAPGAVTQVYLGLYFVTKSDYLIPVDPMLAVLLAVQYSHSQPNVLVFSYAGPELGATNASAFLETSLEALGAMGISVLASSGDTGAFWPTTRAEETCNSMAALYPASSPYVTAVGGTQAAVVGDSQQEQVASIQTGASITSGGGFSTQFAAPQWQRQALRTYASQNATAVQRNVSMRGVPDVALWAHNFEVVIDETLKHSDGTSVSAPVFGAFVTLMNDARLMNNQTSLGFLNPLLYVQIRACITLTSLGRVLCTLTLVCVRYQAWENGTSSFRDITRGNNNCAGAHGGKKVGSGVCCDVGYAAVPGWDPASGLGAPAFMNLSATLLGQAYASGSCTVGSRVCVETGNCGPPPVPPPSPPPTSGGLPAWALGSIIAGGVVVIVVAVVVVVRWRSRRSQGPAFGSGAGLLMS